MHLPILILLSATLIACAGASQPTAAKPPTRTAGPIVVELFTSEGCSSCPPADRALTELIASYPHIVPLAFHVDYWDNLGWKDRFAVAAFTQRQRTYAAKLGSGTYTPQMVVQGRDQFVGSDKGAAARSLKAAAGAATLPVVISARKPGEPIEIRVTLPEGFQRPAASHLCAALTEDRLVSDVKRGENANQKLTHDGVVRAFATVPGADVATITLTPPEGVNETNSHVVVFLQDDATLHITGAARIPCR